MILYFILGAGTVLLTTVLLSLLLVRPLVKEIIDMRYSGFFPPVRKRETPLPRFSEDSYED